MSAACLNSQLGGNGTALCDCQQCKKDRKPRTLHCLHTFYESYLNTLLQDKTIVCPVCNFVTSLTKDDIRLLPVNLERPICHIGYNEDMCHEEPMVRKYEDDDNEYVDVETLKERVNYVKKTRPCDVCGCCRSSYRCVQCAHSSCKLCKNRYDLITRFSDHRGFGDYESVVENLQTEMSEIKMNLEHKLQNIVHKENRLKENMSKISVMKSMLVNKYEQEQKRCSDIKSLIEEIDDKYENDELILRHSNRTKSEFLEKLKGIREVNQSEGDLLDTYTTLKRKSEEALNMIKARRVSDIEIPMVPQGMWNEAEELPKMIEKIKNLVVAKVIYAIGKSNSTNCSGQITMIGNHVLLSTDEPNSVIRLNEKGKTVAIYYPEIQSEKVTGVKVFLNKIYILQDKGITVHPLGTQCPKEDNRFLDVPLHEDSKICVLSPTQILISDPKERFVCSFNPETGVRTILVTDLEYPTYITTTINKDGRMFLVTDRKANMIKVYNHKWELVKNIGPEYLNYPTDTVITEMGTVLVCSKYTNRISHFKLNGKFLSHVVDRLMLYPTGLAYNYPYLWMTHCGSNVKCVELLKR